MRDIYLYDDVNVMKNKFNIKDSKKLEQAEADITYVKLLDVDRFTIDGKFDLLHLKAINKYIFSDIYEWAGELRKENIEKPEEILNGLSVEYTDYSLIRKETKNALYQLRQIKWNDFDFDELINTFAKQTAKIWKIHPFRDGNTRTIMTFMTQYAQKNNINFDRELIAENSKFLRKALVMASIGEYSEYKYLINILKKVIKK